MLALLTGIGGHREGHPAFWPSLSHYPPETPTHSLFRYKRHPSAFLSLSPAPHPSNVFFTPHSSFYFPLSAFLVGKHHLSQPGSKSKHLVSTYHL